MMNKFGRFLGRISAETCLKINYFGSKFPKIAKRWLLPRHCSAILPTTINLNYQIAEKFADFNTSGFRYYSS